MLCFLRGGEIDWRSIKVNYTNRSHICKQKAFGIQANNSRVGTRPARSVCAYGAVEGTRTTPVASLLHEKNAANWQSLAARARQLENNAWPTMAQHVCAYHKFGCPERFARMAGHGSNKILDRI